MILDKCLKFLRPAYDRIIRPHLPRKIGVYNGVPVRDRGLLDITDRVPSYESAICNSLREQVTDGDEVVIVGGGKGVTTVVAGTRTGPRGNVTVFEGGAEQFDKVLETVKINELSDRVAVKQAVVGPDVRVYGDSCGSENISPSKLPECDVLELDCEGAEIGILREMKSSPRVIIVETHAKLGTSKEDVRSTLNKLNYTVVKEGIENKELGIFVLTATKNQL